MRIAAAALSLSVVSPAFAEPVPRQAPAAGAVVSTKLGEEIVFVEAADWRGVEVLQDVKTGDVLRTNAFGQIAILFSDQTQIRLGRNSTLLVKDRVPGGDTRLELQRGQIFGRAARGGTGVAIETVAATAAVRGTDWTMSVEGERTSLSVLEGAVELANPQGTVLVRQGEAAAATLGSAPSKIVVVASDIREQMLVNLSLRGAFQAFPATPLSAREASAARRRLTALPLARRTAEDRVLSAELAIARNGRAAAVQALREARAIPLSATQEARATLVEAMIAGAEARYADAARLYDKALPRLSGERRSAALYQRYFARSLADPSRAETPPALDPSDRISVVGEAVTRSFLQSPRAGLAVIQAAEPRFRDDAQYQATLAVAALLAGNYDLARAASDRAARLDPSDPEVLSARATIRAQLDRDLDGALADLKTALDDAPGDADLHGTLGLLQAERGADREAEAAYRRAIELDPLDPVARANYAILLVDQGRIAEARAMTDAALEVDPAFDAARLVEGTRLVREGRSDEAVDSLLMATTATPDYANGLLALGAVHAGRGELELATQAFENADRLDPLDPVTAQYRALLAIDQYRADEAIRFANQSVDRTRARGGDYASVAATRDSGSTVGDAYRFLSLDEWGGYWGDRVFDPFTAGGYFDQAISGSAAPFVLERGRQIQTPDGALGSTAFSSLAQGLLLDPLALVGPELRPAFTRAPFTEGSVSGGPLYSGDDWGGTGSAAVQSLGYAPMPYSALVSVNIDELDTSFAAQSERTIGATAAFGLQPTGYDRVVGFFTGSWQNGGVAQEALPATFDSRTDSEGYSAFLGWSHTFAHRNVLNAALFASSINQTLALRDIALPSGIPLEYRSDSRQDLFKATLAHTLGLGDLTLRTGLEAGQTETRGEQSLTAFLSGGRLVPGFDPFAGRNFLVPPFPRLNITTAAADELVLFEAEGKTRDRSARAWIDGLYDLTPSLKLEAALFAGFQDEGGERRDTLAPRIGLAYEPFEGQWLRAAFLREYPADEGNTLAPVGVVGLQTSAVSPATERVDTAIARWDAEWTERLFTSVEYQHQDIEDLSLSPDGSITGLLIPSARIDRLSGTANLWIGGGFGAFGTVARLWSRGDLPGTEGALPFVPDVTGRVGLTYVGPNRLKLTAAETYLGERLSNVAGLTLEDAFVTDVFGSWESPDRHLQLDFGVFNLFDREIEVAPFVPTASRTVRVSLTARF